MYKIALVGLPNAGKSSLFNLLTQSNVLTASYPFSTVEPNKAMSKLYDEGILALAAALGEVSTSLPEVEVWDVAGLVKGAADGEGLGNEFLGYIQQCDVLIHTVGLHDDSEQVLADIRAVETEMALFDHKLLLRYFEKARRMARLYPSEKEHVRRDAVVTKAFYGSKEGQVVADILTREELMIIEDIGLVSAKPRLYLFNNFTKSQVSDTTVLLPNFEILQSNVLDLLTIRDLAPNEVMELGYSVSVLHDFMKSLAERLIALKNLKRFYTVGHLGVGLWLVSKEANAAEASKALHTDMSSIVTGVKVAELSDFMVEKSWQQLTKKGFAKKLGVKYVPVDRQVLLFETSN